MLLVLFKTGENLRPVLQHSFLFIYYFWDKLICKLIGVSIFLP